MYTAAPESINALNTEVACISAALIHLKELFDHEESNLVNVLGEKPELSRALSVCLTGCDNILSSLDKDMRKLQQVENGGDGRMSLKRRASFLWKQ